jgi:hypothetical protein
MTTSASNVWRKAIVALFLAAILGGAASAQLDAAREFRDDLFAPDLILREAETIKLSDEQRNAVTALVKEMKQSFKRDQPKLQAANDRLSHSLKASSIEEQTALDQFAAVLDAERDIKRAQFLMLLRAKNLLSPSQQERLRAIALAQPPKDPSRKQTPTSESTRPDARQELNARMQQVQLRLERWREEGRDPAPILELMKLFGEQMQAGRISEAKQTLQRAIERLDEPKPR